MSEIKVGSDVTVFYDSEPTMIRSVERETKLFWVVGGEKYKKTTLRKSPRTSSWHWCEIKPTADEHRHTIRARNARYRLRNTDWSKVHDNTVIEMARLIQQPGDGA